METKVGATEIDRLERGLLLDKGSDDEDLEAEDDEPVLYSACFEEAEEDFVKYKTAQWILYSLLLILAWGIGLLMLLYLPVRRYILRQIIRSRKLYVTPTAIVYKVTKPVPFPCFGVLKKEKHVLLPLVADIVIEQGYLQSHFGVYSLRIENVGVRRPPSDDVHIEGIANPRAFRKKVCPTLPFMVNSKKLSGTEGVISLMDNFIRAVLTHLLNMRSQALPGQGSTMEDVSHSRIGHSSTALMSPSKSLSHVGELAILEKLEEVGSSVKRVQILIEEQNPPTH